MGRLSRRTVRSKRDRRKRLRSLHVIDILSTLWRWRSLVRRLAAREFKVRYAGSALGAAWAVLEPAVQFGLYLVLFSVLLGMRLEQGAGVGNFGLYLVSGLIPFLALQESWSRAVELARGQAQLVRHVGVPLEVFLAGTHLAVLARYGVALGLVMVYAAWVSPTRLLGAGWLALAVLVFVAGSFGVALILMPAGAFLPDLGRVVSLAMLVFLFATPIVYPETVLPGWIVPFLALNPLVGMVDTFRGGTMGAAVMPLRLAVFVGFSVLALLVGGWVFSRRAAAVRDLV